jgi:hypothetical protein
MPAEAQEQTIRARIIRADGTIEELGVVSYYHKNPLRRWAWRIGQLFRKLKGK